MKKTLIALMALAGVAMAAPLNLDTKYTDASGVSKSFFKEDANLDIAGFSKIDIAAQTLTFYIEISDLYGADALVDGYTYELTSISWQVGSSDHDGTFWTGGNRSITISNGDDVCSANIEAKSGYGVTVNFSEGIKFTSTDRLTVTMTGNAQQHVGLFGYDRTTDAAKAANVTGVAWGIDNSDNPVYNKINTGTQSTSYGPSYNKGYNDVALRLTVIPEPATATLSLLALAGLAARRRRK